MDRDSKPDINLAKKVLPSSLFAAIQYIFDKDVFDTALVGGTALAGFYAGHRRSDDIDLFSGSEKAQASTVLVVKSLESMGARKLSEQESAYFYDSTWSHEGHNFTIQVVLDRGVFNAGTFYLADKIKVASLDTIFKMKAATLVSRCSEKDLFDLVWLFETFPDLHLSDLIALGFEIDVGVNAENILASVSGTSLREDACDFSLDETISQKTIYSKIQKLRKELKDNIILFLKSQPTPELGKFVKRARKVLK